MNSTVVILPGSGNPSSPHYRSLYAMICEEARRRGLDVEIVIYPGQNKLSEESLSYQSALEHSLKICQLYSPQWLIARSFGCDIAAGLLGSGDKSIQQCVGAVLWGPGLSNSYNRFFGSHEAQQKEIAKHLQMDVRIAPDFFETLPALEDSIGRIACNLRLARGLQDQFNTSDDLELLEAIHRQEQPMFHRQVIEIDVDHSGPSTSSPLLFHQHYAKCLFSHKFPLKLVD